MLHDTLACKAMNKFMLLMKHILLIWGTMASPFFLSGFAFQKGTITILKEMALQGWESQALWPAT